LVWSITVFSTWVSRLGMGLPAVKAVASPTRNGFSLNQSISLWQVVTQSLVTTGKPHFIAAVYFCPDPSGQIKWVLPLAPLALLSLLANISWAVPPRAVTSVFRYSLSFPL